MPPLRSSWAVPYGASSLPAHYDIFFVASIATDPVPEHLCISLLYCLHHGEQILVHVVSVLNHMHVHVHNIRYMYISAHIHFVHVHPWY